MQKKLYERKTGKEMKGSQSWSLTEAEKRPVRAVAVFFSISVIAVLLIPFIQVRWFMIAAIVCCVVSFVSIFAVLFGLVRKKSKEKPMEKHYYDVDYTYNVFTGEDDRKREISAEEFHRPSGRQK